MNAEPLDITVDGTSIHLRRLGSGPSVLLLHGFPQTHRMWQPIASLLAQQFTVICPDLRGYGKSGCPPSLPDHSPYAKRAMAEDMVAVMDALGFSQFSVAGHDRGGRVAYRLALDHPDRLERLAVLDIIPTLDVWELADSRITAFWPWSLLSQPEPLPERLILSAPEAIVDDALQNWGSPAVSFDASARAAYIDALRDSAHVHAICEEYRAAATIDIDHDRKDRLAGKRISCPILALWSGRGPLETWYGSVGGPLGLWRRWANDVRGRALDGGHFLPEELPHETGDRLARFFSGSE